MVVQNTIRGMNRVRKQWRIQDFPEGVRQPQGGGANLLCGQIFPKNCTKMKEIGPREGAQVLDATLRSASGGPDFIFRTISGTSELFYLLVNRVTKTMMSCFLKYRTIRSYKFSNRFSIWVAEWKQWLFAECSEQNIIFGKVLRIWTSY